MTYLQVAIVSDDILNCSKFVDSREADQNLVLKNLISYARVYIIGEVY